MPANTTTGQAGGAAVFESDGDRCTFVKFGFGDQIQPRLGLNFNVRPGKGDKVYANWGRYYNMDQQSSGRSLAPRRIYQREARYAVATGALISDLPRASTTGKLIDPDLKPTYNDEWLAGYATPHRAGTGASTSSTCYRNTKNFIEDVPSVYPATGPYAAANLPCTLFEACRGSRGQAQVPGGDGGGQPPVRQPVERQRQLHLEPVRGEHRLRLRGWRHVRLQHLVHLPGRARDLRPGPRTATAPCARTGRTCSRSSPTTSRSTT